MRRWSREAGGWLRARPGASGMAALALISTSLAALAVAWGPAVNAPLGLDTNESIIARLKERLPNTEISAVDCQTLEGLCEVIAGPNLFYTDPQARFLVIGRVYDLETRADVTAARLLEVSPDTLARSAPTRSEAPRRAARKIDLASLPKAGAIAWGRPEGPRVIVFSDLACPYCRMLHQALARAGARVEEYPIAILNSRAQAEGVLCASNPAAALAAHYRGQVIPAGQPSPACDPKVLATNQAYFEAKGWQGTPVLIRGDGQVHIGALDLAGIKAWLAEEAAG